MTHEVRPGGYAVVTIKREPVNSMDLRLWQQLMDMLLVTPIPHPLERPADDVLSACLPYVVIASAKDTVAQRPR